MKNFVNSTIISASFTLFAVLLLSSINLSFAQPPPCCLRNPIDDVTADVGPTYATAFTAAGDLMKDASDRFDPAVDNCEDDPSKTGCSNFNPWTAKTYDDILVPGAFGCVVRVFYQTRTCATNTDLVQYRINDWQFLRSGPFAPWCGLLESFIRDPAVPSVDRSKRLNQLEIDIFRALSKQRFLTHINLLNAADITIDCDDPTDNKFSTLLVRGSCTRFCLYSFNQEGEERTQVLSQPCTDSFCCVWKEEFCMDTKNTATFDDDEMVWNETVDSDLGTQECSAFDGSGLLCPTVDKNGNPIPETPTPLPCVNSCDVNPLPNQ